MKECKSCHIVKENDEFPRDKRLKSGLLFRCKECQSKASKEYRLSHLEAVNDVNREYRRSNKERVNERNRESYRRNKTIRRATQKKYETKMLEFGRENINSRYSKRRLAEAAKTRAKRYNVPFSITADDFDIPELCPVLGVKLERAKVKMTRNSVSLDRIIPELGYVPGNIIVVCMRANSIKQDASPDEIIRVGTFFKRIEHERETQRLIGKA